MAAEDARMKAGLKTAEDELNLIKNQVQQTLLDIREHILDATNPFSAIDDALTDEDEIEFGDDLMSGGGAGAAGADGADGDGEGGDDGDDSDSIDGSVEGEDGEDDEFMDDEGEEPEDEFVEELPDDGYMGDEIIDDGGGSGGMSSGMDDAEEVFEEEEIVPDEDEGFELDEELEDDEAVASVEDGAEPVEIGPDGVPLPPTADFDVLTMAGLVRWVAVTTERLGPNRTEILLDAFEAAGRIAPSTRSVLHHLMALSEEDPSENVPVREIVSAMVRMEGVLDTDSGSDTSRLLSMLMDVDDDPMDRFVA